MGYYLFFFMVVCLQTISAQVYRLPKTVKPFKYILSMEPHLDPNLDPATYNGSVVIYLRVNENTNNITLNVAELTIEEKSVKINDGNGNEILVTEKILDEENETYVIDLDQELVKGENYRLTIGNFTGTLGTSVMGFYLGKYTNQRGQQRRFAVTDFEPSNARRAFPCFDEPAFKARFTINLIRRKGYSSISNQELKETVDLGHGRYQDMYKETPDMCTYLVAFVVSDFEATPLTHGHRIFAVPGEVAKGRLDYCLAVSIETVKHLEEFTGMKYTLNKVDQIALPKKYFKGGAMENWGLVTYSDQFLLCSNSSITDDIKTCTTYIAHELGHQWFGNIVSPSWWEYAWLSESFASFLQYYIASLVQPSWRLMDQFIIDNLQKSFDQDDTGRNQKALNFVITYSGEFPDFWLVYQKGGSIVRMIQHFLTPKIFQKSLRRFLEDKKFSSASPFDLYKAVQTSVDEERSNHLIGNLSMKHIISSWDNNPGYPVVYVERNYKTGSITFEQKKFYRGFASIVNKTEPLWYIPINYAFSSDPPKKFWKTTAELWLTEKSILADNGYSTEGWLLVNLQQTGYYRVNYDIENWERLIQFLNNGNFEYIPVINRAQLIDDAFDLGRAGQLPFDIPVRLSEYLLREKADLPVASFLEFMEHMEGVLPYQDENAEPDDYLYFRNCTFPTDLRLGSTEYEIYQNFTYRILNKVYQRLGFDDRAHDTQQDRLNRVKIVKWLSNNNHTKCNNDIVEAFSKLRESRATQISPDLQEIVFCKGVQDKADWDFLAHLYLETSNDDTRNRIYEGLECNSKFGNRKLLKTFAP